ncbi:epithelial cell-transforming sequence 2 oncogene-like [Orbicella faveolata]|uniref:epithelial cell-transforming sequence 2 oncogene-like n=1 Tax=Orbicella faveolata TaxID=48498 RepID=UPI0009E5DD3B|nr:epithelial cell-transforming sequence 2 oncogene-like [Orbicella faveolata]
MSVGTPRNGRPTSGNIKKTRKTEAFATENEIVGARGNRKPRISPSVIEHGFHTDKYKTHYSAWTPVVNSASNSKIFVERLDLIGHWFSLWTDAQRKKFLAFILKKCTKSQLRFVNEGWFKKQLPIHHLDYTTVLPRFISTCIFSFLDPRSLCRAAQVSWQWKFISEQDVIWMPKCLQFGWYLPYTPSSREYGCWKHHYIMCAGSLDMEAPSRMAEKYGQFADSTARVSTQKREKQKGVEKRQYRETKYYRQETRRPPWLDTDPQPHDLENARKALFYEHNPNQPHSPDQLRAERLGLSTRPPHRRSHTAPAHMRMEKVEKDGKIHDVNGNVIEEGKEPVHPSKLTLTEALAVESGGDESVVEQSWATPAPKSPVRRQDLTCGIHPSAHDSVLETRKKEDLRSQPCPAVIFISSEIPAAELLLEAVMFGVIAIPYEYEGTTLDALMEKLRLALQGRQARSIGVFAWGDSGTLRLVKGQTLSLETVNEPSMRHFWETLTISVTGRESGGHVDIFVPLVETEQGMDLLVQLGLLTDMQFSCPTGMTGSFARVESDWLFVPNSGSPPSLYFNATKLGAWSSTVDYIEECVDVVKKNLNCFFCEEQRNLAKRLVGQITFEALGMCEVYRVSEIASVLVDAVISLGKDNASRNWSDPVQGLIHYLQNYGHKDRKLKKVQKTMTKQEEALSDLEVSDSEDDIATREFETDKLASKPGTGATAGEKRTLVAHEILSTELTYMSGLSIIQDVFKKPLQASLASNRAIISSANIQSLFADSQTLLGLSSLLVNDLSNRLDEWNSHQMLGDIFLRFTTQLRAYTNFLNNYPVTLQTLERCKEQNPQFRSFLGRQERQPSTKMMSLPELLFLPGRRIKSYVELLESFMKYTPSDHVDRKNLAQAIAKFKDLDSLFRQYKERLERERFLQDLQKRIINCPVLAEKSRHFVREEDVILLSTPSIGRQFKPEFRIYQQVGDLGLFLFNDALVVTTLTFKFVPFQRLVQRNYKFQACLTLKKLQVENLADSKCKLPNYSLFPSYFRKSYSNSLSY